MNQYWLGIDGKKEGPLRLEQVRMKLNSGDVGKDTLCWSPGMNVWKKVSEFAEFTSFFKNKVNETQEVASPPILEENALETQQTNVDTDAETEVQVTNTKIALEDGIKPAQSLPSVPLWRRAVAKILDLFVIGSLHLSLITVFNFNYFELINDKNYFWVTILSVRSLRSWYSTGIGFFNIPGAGIVILVSIISMFLHHQFYKKLGDYRWNVEGHYQMVNQGKITALNIILIAVITLGVAVVNSNLMMPQLIVFLENNSEILAEIKKIIPDFDMEILKKP